MKPEKHRLPVMIRASERRWLRSAMEYLELEPRLQGIAEDGHTAVTAEMLSNVWGLLVIGGAWDATILDRYPRLEVVALTRAQTDPGSADAMSSQRITVCTGDIIDAEVVADQALSLLLAAFRNLLEVDATVRRGAWRPVGLANDLHHATVGVVGKGRAAREIALRLAAFECEIVAIDHEGLRSGHPPETDLRGRTPRGNQSVTALDAIVMLPSATDADRLAAERFARVGGPAIKVVYGEDGHAFADAVTTGEAPTPGPSEVTRDVLAVEPKNLGKLRAAIVTRRRPPSETLDADIALRRTVASLASLAARGLPGRRVFSGTAP